MGIELLRTETKSETLPPAMQGAGDDDIPRRAWTYYYRLRERIETEENIGKLIVIEVNTGDYEIGTDHVQAVLTLRSRHLDPTNITLRIGYTAAFQYGGGQMRRLPAL